MYGSGILIPAGQFSAVDLANPTVNYYALQHEFAFTYFPIKTLEISSWAVININAKNPKTDYHSGDLFSIDWGINWAPITSIPNLFFGVQGNYFNQFTDDEINGVKVGPDGFRLSRLALGPQVVYYVTPKAGIVAKYQREFETENGPQGDRYWIEFVTPIALK